MSIQWSQYVVGGWSESPLLWADGRVEGLPLMSKAEVAARVLAVVANLLEDA